MRDRANTTTVRRDTVPWLVRLAAGAVVGWLIADRLVGGDGPSWTGPAAAATLAIAFVAAPGVDPWAGSGVVSGWALATALGLYVGVPETDQIVGVIAVLLVLWGAELAGRARVDWLVVCGLDAVLVLAAIHGAAGRPGALIAALAMLGLLVVAGPVSRLPRTSRSLPAALAGPDARGAPARVRPRGGTDRRGADHDVRSAGRVRSWARRARRRRVVGDGARR